MQPEKESYTENLKKQVEEGDDEVFKPITADENDVKVVPSLCEHCGEQGTTRILLTVIPFFREVILMSFYCDHCKYRSTQVQYGGKIQPKGCTCTLDVKGIKDVNRQVIKSDFATIKIPHLQFEIPPESRQGVLSTVQGFLTRAADDLDDLQPDRRKANPEIAAKIDDVIKELRTCASGSKEFTFIIDDPSGNSFIENPNAPSFDPLLRKVDYYRSKEQSEALALNPDDDVHNEDDEIAQKSKLDSTELVPDHKDPTEITRGLPKITKDEAIVATNENIIETKTQCSVCSKEGDLRTTSVNIPYFKEVLLIAFSCPHCGYRTNEVKNGGGIPPKGKRITLINGDKNDLSRSFLKSETCEMEIKELDIKLTTGTLGSKFTTCEGILRDVYDAFANNPFLTGDSADPIQKEKFDSILEKLQMMIDGKMNFTLALVDPLGNSYIQNLNAPNPDPKLVEEEYERSFEENEELGLNDINTDHYAEKDKH